MLISHLNILFILVCVLMSSAKTLPSFYLGKLPLASNNILKNFFLGQPIFQLLTVDLDQENTPNSQVLYFLVSQTPLLRESGFRIDLISGEVRLSGCLNYEVMWILLF